MLEKPCSGWCNIWIGKEKIGTASYLTDVPVDTLDAFIQYFSPDNFLNFRIQYDAEGYYFGILDFNSSLYLIDDRDEDGLLNSRLPEDFQNTTSEDILLILAKEVISDVEEHFEEWIRWETGYDYMTGQEKEQRRNLLKEKTKILKKLIQEKNKE